MTFRIILFILILAMVYWHYLQGFFSATLSAIYSVMATAVALGFHENMVNLIAPSGLADSANAIATVVLFAVTYLVLRLLSDRLVPGNLRMKVWVDRIGAVVMGLVAAIFAVGVLAVAAQMLPFGPSIGGYARYTILSVSGTIPVTQPVGPSIDRPMTDFMVAAQFPATPDSTMMCDDLVIGAASSFSAGCLSNGHPLHQIHPNYLQELFGARIGIEPAARHTAQNWNGEQVGAETPYTLHRVRARDAELPSIRKQIDHNYTNVPDSIDAQPDALLLVVPVVFNSSATDKDSDMVRLTCGSVRLVTKNGEICSNHFPMGTWDPERHVLYLNHVDDPIFVRTHILDTRLSDKVDKNVGHAYFVFEIPRTDVLSDIANPLKMSLRDGAFLEIKQLARLTLADPKTFPDKNPQPPSTVLEKEPPLATSPHNSALPVASPVSPTPTAPKLPVKPVSAEESDRLPVPVKVGSPAPGATRFDETLMVALQAGKVESLTMHMGEPIASPGAGAAQHLLALSGRLVQITCDVSAENPWDIAAELPSFELSDGQIKLPARGAWMRVKQTNGEDRYVMFYRASDKVEKIAPEPGTFTQLVLIFEVADPKKPLELFYKKQSAGRVTLTQAATQ